MLARVTQGMCSDQMSPSSQGTLFSAELWDNSSGGLAESQNDGPVAGLFQAGFSSMVQQLSESHNHVAQLECELKSLKEEKLKREYQNHVCVTRLKDQIRILEQKTDLDLEELKRRQNQIEAEVPSLEEQIKSLKYVLHDLNISETLYSELTSIPKESRTIREHILILAYEKMLKYQNDLQSTRHERDTSREALSRANDEVQKLRREMQRSAASDAVEKQAKDKEIEALISRNEQLETELQNISLEVQVSSAKGALYDELRCKLVQLEELLLVKEREKTEASKAFQNISKEKAECEKDLSDKQHCIEVLHLEKVEKVQLQERNKQELDLLRIQIAEAADFEIQMIRRTRDLAVSEYDKAQVALQESRTQKEQLIERINELKLENAKNLSEDGGVSQRESELQRVQEGTYHDLCQAKIENKVLTEKLKSSTQNLLKLESEFTKAVLDFKLELEGANSSLHHYQTGEQLLNEAILNTCKVLSDVNYEAAFGESEVVCSMQGKLDIISTFSKRYKMLQEHFKSVESERETLKLQILGAEEKMDNMIQKMACVDQPRSFLVNSILQKEKELKEALRTKEALWDKLREAIMDKNKANRNLQNLRNDLRRVLEARGNMDSLKQILMEKDPNLGNALSQKLATLKNSPLSL
ncbi:hypothetical protein GOP47_0013974 [Adiantum capillus-veneris]|uniref:Uncharacterized protein n=1 Tax=Adiantum capillus-veneris TaxID=13818 RepID=A0A9D4ZDQ9_ADICA|nr:hypothetical protein GOP47_0013974 [Adiantum capillus-veneris]